MAKKATGARRTAATQPTETETPFEQITPLGEEPAKTEQPAPKEETAEPVPESAAPPLGSPVKEYYGLWRVIVGRVLHFLHDPATPHEWAKGGCVVKADNDFLAEQVMRQQSKLNHVTELPEGEEPVAVTRNDVLALAARYKTTPVDAALGRKKLPSAPLI